MMSLFVSSGSLIVSCIGQLQSFGPHYGRRLGVPPLSKGTSTNQGKKWESFDFSSRLCAGFFSGFFGLSTCMCLSTSHVLVSSVCLRQQLRVDFWVYFGFPEELRFHPFLLRVSLVLFPCSLSFSSLLFIVIVVFTCREVFLGRWRVGSGVFSGH